ncbi:MULTISPECIES: hypothetical protein [Paenibacillus]|nr:MULTISPECIES: hypothetical protein [Paenibacillus]
MEQLKTLKAASEKICEFIDFEIFDPEQLDREQIGYAMDPEGNSLVTGEEGAWQDGWLVIGYMATTGDPIIIETNEPGQPVAVLMHGLGHWGAGSYIAGSAAQFIEGVNRISRFLSLKTGGESGLQVTCDELDGVVHAISNADEYADSDTWKTLLEPAYSYGQEQEDELVRQVRAMNEQGMRIKDIAEKLQVPIKAAYGILKKARGL